MYTVLKAFSGVAGTSIRYSFVYLRMFCHFHCSRCGTDKYMNLEYSYRLRLGHIHNSIRLNTHQYLNIKFKNVSSVTELYPSFGYFSKRHFSYIIPSLNNTMNNNYLNNFLHFLKNQQYTCNCMSRQCLCSLPSDDIG